MSAVHTTAMATVGRFKREPRNDTLVCVPVSPAPSVMVDSGAVGAAEANVDATMVLLLMWSPEAS